MIKSVIRGMKFHIEFTNRVETCDKNYIERYAWRDEEIHHTTTHGNKLAALPRPRQAAD